MLRSINRKKIYFYIFSLFFITTILNPNFLNSSKDKFLIKNIEIKSNDKKIDGTILSKINHLLSKNILYLKKNLILDELYNLRYLENLNIKKKYPSTIIVKTDKTELIAITYINQNKYFLGKNGKFILSKNITNRNQLPIIFGNFEILDFLKLKKELKKNNLDQSIILKYYFHKNKRWDLYLENNIILKLPNKNISSALKIYNEFSTLNNIKTNTLIDLRVKNRIIVNNE